MAVTFDANRGPVPYWSRLNVAWPAPGRLAFVARIAGSDRQPGKYRLVYVDPRTGKLTPSVILASDPNTSSRVEVSFLDFDPSGRYLLYGTAWTRLGTWWVGGEAPVKVSQFSAFDTTSRAYTGGNW